MHLNRRGLAHRAIALLLAVAMPLCCCAVNAFAGSSGCCSAEVAQVVDTPSCCQTATSCATENQTPEAACENTGSCSCCLKGPAPTFDWTVPVDTIGMPALMLPVDFASIDGVLNALANTPGWGDAPPPLPRWLHAAAQRGIIIHNC